MRAIFTMAVSVLAVMACSEQSNSANQMHPVEAVTIVFEQTGMQSGTVIQSHDDYANLRYENNDLSVSMMGMTQVTKDWVVYRDGFIYRGDPAKMTVIKTANPIQADLEAAMENKTPEEIAFMFLGAMGANATGETGTFAGESCSYYDNPQNQMRLCMTEDLLTLYMRAGFGPMVIERTATSVDRGNGGGSDLYDMPPDGYTVTDGPDINAIMQGLGNN